MEVIGKMKKKIIKLTENDIQRIVKKVINEDFFTRLGGGFGGLIAGLKGRKESADARQLLRLLGRLNTYTNQVSPFIINLKNDLEKLQESRLIEKAFNVDDKTIGREELKSSANELQKSLSEYKSAIDEIIKIQEKFKSFDLNNPTKNSTTPTGTDELTV
jgi:hypothetical protein